MASKVSAALVAFGMLKFDCESRERFGQLLIEIIRLDGELVRRVKTRRTSAASKQMLSLGQRTQAAPQNDLDRQLAAFIDCVLDRFLCGDPLITEVCECGHRIIAHQVRR